MDHIKIQNLEVYGNHGVFPEEKTLGQKFLVSADLYTDVRQAGMTDDLSKSIHYGQVCRQIYSFMKENSYHLIEAAAEHLARRLLLTWERLSLVRLEIKKPWAPIGLPLDTVSVEITRGWHQAYIGLGSNLGDKKGYLDKGIKRMEQEETIRVEKVSSYLETAPYGEVKQDNFLNGGVRIRTLKTPGELLCFLQDVEKEAGRERTLRWGPRTLDLDLWFYDDQIIDTEDLTVPHPDLQNRDFVLRPMMELAPYYRHPVFGKTIRQLWEEYEMKQEGEKK